MEFQHIEPGKDPAFVRIKIRSVLSGKTVDKTFNADPKVETAIVDRCNIQCLCKDGNDYVFMDVESYEQTYVPSATVGEAATFMLEGQEVIVAFRKDLVLFVELLVSMVLTISHTEPSFQGNRSSAGIKPATIETGAKIQVPLFLDTGDKVKANARSGSYIPRVNG